MRRVLVIGSPGAGKSTFARELARRTALPLTHLDAEYWLPGWVRPESADWESRLRQLTLPDAWILGGNYTSTVALRAGRADTVLVLDFPRTLCLWRAVRRALTGGRIDTLNLGREPLDWAFLKFIWKFPAGQEKQLSELAAWRHLRVIRLHADADARKWLATLPGSA